MVIKVDPHMHLEELEQLIQTGKNLLEGCFSLSLSGKVLDSARLSSLTQAASVRVHFRLRGGMLRVPRDSPSQWTRDYCAMTRYWAAHSTCYRCGEARGHTEERERRRHFRYVARAAREGSGTTGSAPAAAPPTSAPWVKKTQPARTVPPRASSTMSLGEHNPMPRRLLRKPIRMIRNRQLLFERPWRCCDR